MITQITEKFKKVDHDFKELEQKRRDLEEYEKTLEKAEEVKKNQLPKWRRVIEDIVDRALDFSSMIINKIEIMWKSFHSKIFVFIQDVKAKSEEAKIKNSTLKKNKDK